MEHTNTTTRSTTCSLRLLILLEYTRVLLEYYSSTIRVPIF